MNKITLPPTGTCPVCGASGLQEQFRCTDHFVSGEVFPVLRCDSCGFRWTGAPPAEEEIGAYYQSEEYISHSNTSRGIVSRAYHLVRHYMAGRKASVVERYAGSTTGSLLDIGAGTGFFLHFMGQRGWRITGTEPSETARRVATSERGLSLLPAEALFSLPDSSFDVITLWHVLEHLHDPALYWSEFRRLLRPSGTLILALPNPESWDARHYGKFWAAWDVPRHLWHFSPSTLERMATTHHFRLLKTLRMPFDSFYVSILSEKYRKSTLPLLRGAWYGTLSWGNALVSKNNCSSLIYILQPE